MPDAVRLVMRAISAIERDAPMCAAAARALLGDRAITLILDDEIAVLRGPELAVSDCEAPGASVAVTTEHLVDVLEGRDTLLAGIHANRIRIRTAARVAANDFEVLVALLEGCARSREGQALMVELHTRMERERYGTEHTVAAAGR